MKKEKLGFRSQMRFAKWREGKIIIFEGEREKYSPSSSCDEGAFFLYLPRAITFVGIDSIWRKIVFPALLFEVRNQHVAFIPRSL